MEKERVEQDPQMTIARNMLDAILYDNDMVNRENPLDEDKLRPWVIETYNALTIPFRKLGKDFFTEDWIDEFCCGDDDFMMSQIAENPSLFRLHCILNDFFDYYDHAPGQYDLDVEIENFKKSAGYPVYWCNEDDQLEWLKVTALHFADWQKRLDRSRTLPAIQWKGDNLMEVLKFTGLYEGFNQWFKSFDEYEKFVHESGDVFKIFCDNGDHYNCEVGTWIVKLPNGTNFPIGASYIIHTEK